jgi:dolichol-phosphate mannosyltransferase
VLTAASRYVGDILVVDDGSTDRTPELLHRVDGVRSIRHARNLGYGRSLIDAFDYALARGYEWLITMDCDEQHEPAAIPGFLGAIVEDGADIISGSRYLRRFEGDDAPPADRRAINQRITRMLNQRFGWNLTDAFCGFKAYRVPPLAGMRITESGYAMPLQFWVQAAWLGLRIRELPVRLVYNDPRRQFGGGLDNPELRYRHYLTVFEAALCDLPRESDAPESRCRRSLVEKICSRENSTAFAQCLSS